jgi:hypothetical protein
MFLFSNDLMPNGEAWPLPWPELPLFLPASAEASYACAHGMRSILVSRASFECLSQLGRAWGS